MARFPVSSKVTISIALLSLLLSGFVAYTSGTDEDHQRITVVETQQRNDKDRLERIETKVDKIYDVLITK